ncbi:protein FAM222B-like [Eucyclogobius newberryi]|uniref:protein FAM222B-like n=1 Tax=Eucyclogobius newberryi TaxID=166745 RepID=UPI003B593B0F
MLACLPASGHSVTSLLCSQMNTGPPRWETTQKMRSPSFPSPAELDAYAKKVANSPLTIQIFPNSVKVPQRKHVRRTVNGLDTSSQRHSPYSSQLSASAGLLAVLRTPVKQLHTNRARTPQKSAMNLHSGPYGPPGTLNSTHMQGTSQQPPLTHPMGLQQTPQTLPQTLQQTVQHPPTLQHRGMPHPGPLQQQSLSHHQTVQKPVYPQGLQRQQSVPQPQQCAPPPQQAPQLHTLRHHGPALPHTTPHNVPHSLALNGLVTQPQELHHMPQLNMTHQTHPQTMTTVRPSTHSPAGPQPGPHGTHPRPHGLVRPAPQPGGLHPGPPAPQPGGLHPGPPAPQPGGLHPGPPAPQPGGLHPGPPAPQPGVSQQGSPRGPQPMGSGGLQPCPSGGPQQPPPRTPHPDPPEGTYFMGDTAQQTPQGHYGPRKLPDADAPPNVTVSTSTIPLSMATSLHQSRPADLSSIVLQINQLCQARAGMGGTSVCEGQIANPSPISRNLLINASSRVAHPSSLGSANNFHVGVGLDKAPGNPGPSLHVQPNMCAPNGLQSFHSDQDKVQSLLQRSWAQHQLVHMQQPPEESHPCKAPRLESPADCSFAPAQNLNYAHKVPGSGQSFPLKHQDKSHASPPRCSGNSLSYMEAQCLQYPWGPPLERPGFQGPRAGTTDRFPGQKYKPGKEELGVQPKLMPNLEFLPRNFQMPRFGDQSLDVRGPGQEPGPREPLHGHHPGYR